VDRIARAWAELMRRLGYSRYGAHGGDWGARISAALTRIDPSHVRRSARARGHGAAIGVAGRADAGALTRDAILTNVSIYWFTGTAGSAARLYRESAASWGATVARSPVPFGVAVFPGDSTVRRFVARDHEVVHWSEFPRGGHFAALEVPDLLVDDIRAFFRQIR
jgi:pimeloyl-ACP methyl ester carboxylesterase